MQTHGYTSKGNSVDRERERKAWLDGVMPHLWRFVARSHREYASLASNCAELFSQRRAFESVLASSLPPGTTASLPAYCSACHAYRLLSYDHQYALGDHVNWRERLVCPVCQLNNRLRLSFHLFEGLSCAPEDRVYLTEAVTPLAALMRARHPGVVTSEYLGPAFSPGQLDRHGLRHEDVTNLSFPDATFECVMTFDVLEHVPDYNAALAEFWRVLTTGGTLMLSAPFVVSSPETIERARIGQGGEIEHLLPAEYHGDPVTAGAGILCFHHFGWDLLQALKAVGFTDARAELFWSMGFGYVGQEQLAIMATK
jgi:SAM-dependent methyltransferase